MKVTRPYLSFLYAKKLSSVLLLFTIILTGLVLYPSFELKSFVIKPAFGQAVQEAVTAATKTATAENTLAPLRTPVKEPSSHLPNYQQQSFPPPEAFNPTFSDRTPPDTVIPLVTDGNTGSAIQNGGTSDSKSILSITFEGLDETGNSIAGYQCSIDETSNYVLVQSLWITIIWGPTG